MPGSRARSRSCPGRTLGVLGMGPIGMEVARLGAAFGMHVIAMRREPRGDEPCETWPLTRLDELLQRANDLVLALPLSNATHHILDADAIARLPQGARVVNVGRGELVDEAALADALATGTPGRRGPGCLRGGAPARGAARSGTAPMSS